MLGLRRTPVCALAHAAPHGCGDARFETRQVVENPINAPTFAHAIRVVDGDLNGLLTFDVSGPHPRVSLRFQYVRHRTAQAARRRYRQRRWP